MKDDPWNRFWPLAAVFALNLAVILLLMAAS